MLYKHWTHVKPEDWKWNYFTPKELASKGDGSLLVHAESIDKLEAARASAGKPFKINSAYRDEAHNKRVGGSENSMHLQGRAFDVSLKNHTKYDLIKALEDAGFTGFGVNYNDFVHADTGRERRW